MKDIFIIDIGSNSVRLMRRAAGRTLYKETCTTQLSQGLSPGGLLTAAAADRTAAAVSDLVRRARKEGGEPLIFATAAVRQAANGKTFAARIYAETGVMPDIIDGETEARLSFLGAGGAVLPELLMTDIGGASTELVQGKKGRITYLKSVPVGVVRLTEDSGRDAALMSALAADALKQFALPPHGKVLTGVGGTATTLAAVDLCMTDYDPAKTDGHTIPLEGMRALSGRLLTLTVSQTARLPGVPEKRAPVLAAGALLMLKLMEMTGAEALRVSEGDNLEGYAQMCCTER